MSCDTNEKSIDLPESIVLSTPQQPPISEVDHMEQSCIAPDDACEPEPDNKEDVIPKLSITMPSSDVAEISQNFYWPLYTKPVDWIYQCHLSDMDDGKRENMVRRAAEELQSLEFTQTVQKIGDGSSQNNTKLSLSSTDDTLNKVMSELQEEKEDWFSDLSGGQKSKVELVRKVSSVSWKVSVLGHQRFIHNFI